MTLFLMLGFIFRGGGLLRPRESAYSGGDVASFVVLLVLVAGRAVLAFVMT
jgi:hypothetical protein